MRSFALALGVSAVAAFGTTGHYDNDYGHGGFQDHAHEDHIYGYDSVPVDLDIEDQTALLTSIITQVTDANTYRKTQLQQVFDMREQRLTEIYNDNLIKIDAPFDYQIRLLAEEEDDILEARANAVRDSNDAYDDLEWRLDSLFDDIIEDQEIEQERIFAAIERALVDKKNPAKVFLALKIDWMDTVTVDVEDLTTIAATA